MIELKRIAAEDVGVSNDDVSEKALEVVARMQVAGFQAYLVGGCVRDMITGVKPKDFDVATNATPEEVKRLFGGSARIIGRRFRIVHVRYGYEVIEVATFRADAADRTEVGRNEMKEGEQGQLLRDNVFGTIEEDVVRRDFTANSLYYDSVAGEVLDFMNGVEDIRNKKLISIGDPEQRFIEDPVRMLRVIRFAAKLGFDMEPKALELIEEQGKLLSHVSNARLFEEVLKLFHGGSAYDTYLLLRKWGLFKYLFPFTDSMVIEGVEGLPERALQNTDKRVRADKPVIPAFLFACMLWDPVKADAQVLMEDGANESHAWRVAMNDALRDQNQYVAVPKRLADIILDIWNIHFRLIKRNPRMVKACLNNRRFRAAYDFLLLRTMVHEVDEEISEWWTRIQEVDDEERDAMIAEVNENYKQERQQRQPQGEPNGNSINYNSAEYNPYNSFDDGYGANKQQQASNRKRGAGGKKKANKRNAQGGKRTRNTRAKQGQGQGPNRSNAQNAGANKRRSKKQSNHTGGGRRRGAGRTQNRNEGRFMESRPADEFAVTSKSNKKVKVRRKRRIPGAADNSVDDTPHF